jgi:hypothetical protein
LSSSGANQPKPKRRAPGGAGSGVGVVGGLALGRHQPGLAPGAVGELLGGQRQRRVAAGFEQDHLAFGGGGDKAQRRARLVRFGARLQRNHQG